MPQDVPTPISAIAASPSGSTDALPIVGRIDVHSHLLPGVDDGCQDVSESLACVRRLVRAGYIGSICTPHVWPGGGMNEAIEHIAPRVAVLSRSIAQAGLGYRVWPGGEVRLEPGTVDFFKSKGVPTLADSRYVLCDFWEPRWPRWVDQAFDWLLSNNYQPILAHPERLPKADDLDKKFSELAKRGIRLQGNFRSMTGEEGYVPDQVVRKLSGEGRYSLMALDMHGPDSLDGRLDGLSLFEAEFGPELLDRMVVQAPRRLLQGEGL